MDGENVIKGLESLRTRLLDVAMQDGIVMLDVSIVANAIELLKVQEWISVRDRLPNCNGCYLVWRPHFYQDKGMPSICYFDGQNTWHDSYGVDFTRTLAPDDVSHWMPLPEQPCEEVK